jgi:hypothetical protein
MSASGFFQSRRDLPRVVFATGKLNLLMGDKGFHLKGRSRRARKAGRRQSRRAGSSSGGRDAIFRAAIGSAPLH